MEWWLSGALFSIVALRGLVRLWILKSVCRDTLSVLECKRSLVAGLLCRAHCSIAGCSGSKLFADQPPCSRRKVVSSGCIVAGTQVILFVGRVMIKLNRPLSLVVGPAEVSHSE